MSTRATYRSRAPHLAWGRRLAATAVLVMVTAPCLSFVLAPSVVVTQLTNLGFEDVATDATKQVMYSDAGAASFRIDATNFVAQTGIAVTFTLPGVLSSGGDTVPITFSSAGAAWSYTNSAAGATAFDPNTGTSISKSGANFTIYVWIGASITTSGATSQNTFSNALTIDATAQ